MTIYLDYSRTGTATRVQVRLRPDQRAALSVGDVVTVTGDGVPDQAARVTHLDPNSPEVALDLAR